MVAYALYKKAKRLWTRRLWQRNGQKPNQSELEAYVEYWTSDRLEALREEARLALVEFANKVIFDERPKILKEALKGSFWRAVWPSMLASALYSITLILLVIIANRAGIDLLGIIDSAARR